MRNFSILSSKSFVEIRLAFMLVLDKAGNVKRKLRDMSEFGLIVATHKPLTRKLE